MGSNHKMKRKRNPQQQTRGRTLRVEILDRQGNHDVVHVNPQYFSQAEKEGDTRLCTQALARRLTVKVFSLLAVRDRDNKNYQCGKEVIGLRPCNNCEEYREALFALWGKEKLQKVQNREQAITRKEDNREIATPKEVERYIQGDYLSEEDLDRLTDPNRTTMAQALLAAGITVIG